MVRDQVMIRQADNPAKARSGVQGRVVRRLRLRHYFTRAALPPRRLVIWPVRDGSSAMTADRACGDMPDHAAISSTDRRHPVQSRLFGSITQTLMQGLSISARAQM